ncbi:MAG: hypothetical protein OXI87_23595 [Albidovulum sp.]|nr:hypothetical protein [Albidovulum sp.]MDE0533607.1 hypothetical protein [Albidovulum sp.]
MSENAENPKRIVVKGIDDLQFRLTESVCRKGFYSLSIETSDQHEIFLASAPRRALAQALNSLLDDLGESSQARELLRIAESVSQISHCLGDIRNLVSSAENPKRFQ